MTYVSRLSELLKGTESKTLEQLLTLKMREFENAQLRDMFDDLKKQLEKQRTDPRPFDRSATDYG